MTVKAFLEALNNNASIVIKESDNTQIAEFNRNSYKAISDKILASEIDDIEILSKSAISVVLTLKEAKEETPKEEDPAGGTTEQRLSNGCAVWYNSDREAALKISH